MEKVIIDGHHLTINDVVNVARNFYTVELSDEAKERVIKTRKYVDDCVAQEKVIYGLTTGFGKFCDVVISKHQTEDLQKNLIMSHACGVGEPLPEEVVRGMLLLRLNALSVGNSGIRLSTLETMKEMLNKKVHPVVPEKGSLGASGDLAPLSHMILVLIGMGEAFYNGKRMPGEEAMKLAGIEPVILTSKEGLALINGTQAMTSVASLNMADSIMLSKTADVIAALTVEALNGITDAFDPKIHLLRNQTGQINCAENLRNLLADSQMTTKQGEKRVQDAYTLRCIPQIHGASKDSIEYIKGIVSKEINAVTDNPIIFPDEDQVISGGNFHGQPVALAMDFLGIAMAEYANVSERRIERLVNPALSGLPAFLTKDGGINSGFMITQYSAASLVSENKVLAHPASVDSIPSSANQEDHVSMGTIAARKARNIIFNTANVLAIELLSACQAIDLNGCKNKKLGEGTKIAYEILRKEISCVENDRVMYTDINKAYEIIMSGKIIKVIEDELGEIK